MFVTFKFFGIMYSIVPIFSGGVLIITPSGPGFLSATVLINILAKPFAIVFPVGLGVGPFGSGLISLCICLSPAIFAASLT